MRPRPSPAAVFVTFGLLTSLATAPAGAERIEIAAKAVPLNEARPEQEKVGGLTFRGGLALTSAHPRFGGLSALRLSEDGRRITFISDEGSWLTAHLVHDDRGQLVGLDDAELGTLQDLEGAPLLEKEEADAESLARMPDGSMVVGFEHHHRLWRYAATDGRLDGKASVVPPPPGIEKAPANGGIEALVARDNGELVALTEYWIVDKLIRGFVNGPKGWEPLGYRFQGAFRASDMARLPSGDLVVLERAYDPNRGIVGIRLRRVNRKDVKPGAALKSKLIAELAPPVTVDNFEGIDTIRTQNGETLVYLVSDNNFRTGDQRTLLMMFSLDKP